MSRDRIVLVGMMGSGKTTVGRALAARLGWPYWDNDGALRARTGRDVAEVLLDEGSERLHDLEYAVLLDALAAPPPYVVSAPGSAALHPAARSRLAEEYVVWLRARPDTLAARVAGGPSRPFLGGADVAATVLALDAERRDGFAAIATYVVDVDDRTVRRGRRGDRVVALKDPTASATVGVVRTTLGAALVALALAASGCGNTGHRAVAGEASSTPPAPTSAAPTSPVATSPVPSSVAPSPTATHASSRPAAPPPAPSGGVKTNRLCETPPASSVGGYPRTVTTAAPLDLLVTGDSMQESEGPQLTALANAKRHVVAGCTVPKYSTGLVRDDFFDWPAYAKQLMAQRDPEAISFMIGGNDGQNMTVNGRILQAGSTEWAAEYQRRAATMLAAFANGHRKVYWIGMPIARSDRLTGIYHVMNDAVRKATAGVPGVQFVDIWSMFAPHGYYQDSFANEYGTIQRMRGSDGIHLSTAGAAYLARRMLRLLDADWHLT